MSVPLSELLTNSNDKVRNSTTGSLNNNIRTRAINRVLEDLQLYADWQWTRRTKTFYYINGVHEYSLENYVGTTCLDKDGSTSVPDFKSAFELRPVNNSDRPLDQNDPREVRHNIRRNRVIGEYADDEGKLIVSYFRQTSAQLHNCDSLTSNGTVSAGGDATNLTIDSVIYKEGSGALNFDTTSGTSLEITFSGISSKDLTTLQNKSHFVLDAWLPTITNFTSIELRWGSDASNYWSKTETVPAGNTTLETGRNTFAFRWADASQTGSPDVSAIDYLKVIITYSSATTDTDFRLDDIRVGQEVEMEFEYYSDAMVKTASGEYQLGFNSDDVTQTDILLGDIKAKRVVVVGTQYELFERIGGKSDRDRTDSFEIYEKKKKETMKAYGRKIKRSPHRRLNFPSRGQGTVNRL